MTDKILRSDSSAIGNVISCTFKEQVNTDERLRFGAVVAKSIEFEAFGAQSIAPNVGEVLTYYQVDGNGVDTLIGEFIARPSVPGKTSYTVVAYDNITLLETDFSEHLASIQSNFPMTLNDLLDEVESVAGVTFGNTPTLGTTTIEEFSASGVSCRDVVSWAAEISGQYVYADTSGNICFGWYQAASGYKIYKTSGSSGGVTYVPYKQDGLNYKDYAVNAVDGVAVYPPEVEGAAAIYPSAATGNIYSVSNNLLLSGASVATLESVAQTLYTVLSALPPYRPCSVDLFRFDNPLRAGDIVSVEDAQGVSFNTLVMSMTVNMDGAKIECTGRETYNADDGSDVKKSLVNLAENIVRINNLKVNKAEIESAVINVLKANTIDAEWINSSTLNTNELSLTDNLPLQIANIDDPNSLIGPNDYIDNGWITSSDSYITIATSGTDRTIQLIAGAILTVSWEYMGDNVSGGAESDFLAKSGGLWIRQSGASMTWTSPASPTATYGNGDAVYTRVTTAFTVPTWNDDWYDFRIRVAKNASTRCVRNIVITSSISMPTAALNGFGLEVGDFKVDRTGSLTLNGNNVGALSNSTPEDLGTPNAGTSTEAARADHVHNLPNAADLLGSLSYSQSGLGGALSVTSGGYCKVGKLVVVAIRGTLSAAVNAGGTLMTGLPAPASSFGATTNVLPVTSNQDFPFLLAGGGSVNLPSAAAGGANIASGATVMLSVTYISQN